MARVKMITLSTYNKKYGQDPSASLYVVNTSDGRLTMNVLNDQNNAASIIIPMTHAPIDITALVPRINCLNNTTFKRYINRRMLAVVDNESVMEILKEDESLRLEYEKVNNGGESALDDELDLGAQGKQQAALKGQKPDNVSQVSNNKLDSILMDCKGAEEIQDETKRSARIKEILNVFNRSVNQFTSNELGEFIDACNTKELKDAAIEQKEYLDEA